MWHLYAVLAQERMLEHRREAEREAWIRVLAERRRDMGAGRSDARGGTAGPRRIAARVLRGVSAAATALSAHACSAAARLDGRIA